MKPEVAQRRIAAFRDRFGEAHYHFACHAAFPLALTPDLLYRLWANFQRDVQDESLEIPWMAVADVLLSSLCEEVGHELYEMPLPMRNALLSELKANSRFGTARINELSDLLLMYVRQQLESSDPDERDVAQAQRWTALSYVHPAKTVQEIASAFAHLEINEKAEWIRMSGLLETLAEPLSAFQPLLAYSHGMARFVCGDWKNAAESFRNITNKENEVNIAGLSLQLPVNEPPIDQIPLLPNVSSDKDLLKLPLRLSIDEKLEFADELVFRVIGEHFDDLTREIFRKACDGQTYEQIANYLGYSETHVRNVGSHLFKRLSQALGEDVRKSNFQTALIRRHRANQVSPFALPIAASANFVGRERAIADLNQLVSQGAKTIIIQGKRGLGKTTLARKYLDTQGFDLHLELWMPTGQESITPAERVVEEWLRGNFNEEAERDFGINLERLRRRLREPDQRIGVLIDNLESALNGEGRFIDTCRPYVELLRVLADSSAQSVTLITSRERLCETSVNVQHYRPDTLSEEDWEQFFSRCKVHTKPEALSEMWHSYGGNAKAMKILSGVIITDFNADLSAYWQQNKTSLLIEIELNDLVKSQFERIQKNDPEAYALLCRLSVYRYQMIPSVSLEGLLCLLWDIPQERRARIIHALQSRSLLEEEQGRKFWLNSVIRAEGITRLKTSDEWTIANQRAADFWLQLTTEVKDVDDTVKLFEAYYHYTEIGDLERASKIISTLRMDVRVSK